MVEYYETKSNEEKEVIYIDNNEENEEEVVFKEISQTTIRENEKEISIIYLYKKDNEWIELNDKEELAEELNKELSTKKADEKIDLIEEEIDKLIYCEETKHTKRLAIIVYSSKDEELEVQELNTHFFSDEVKVIPEEEIYSTEAGEESEFDSREEVKYDAFYPRYTIGRGAITRLDNWSLANQDKINKERREIMWN